MRLIVVSNRLPLTVTRTNNGFEYAKTSGGLVTGIESLAPHMQFSWIGSIGGTDFTPEECDRVAKDCWDRYRCVPVFLDPELYDRYYNGFCNAILWPTLHSFPDDVCFTFGEYEAYRTANEAFAKRILEKCSADDIVWVHDYHLMLLPGILRRQRPSLRIMFFLHTAFPDPSNLARLLFRDELLRGICAADLAAFHTPEYVRHFRAAVQGHLLPRFVRAVSIGIDPEMFRKALRTPEAQARVAELRERFSGRQIILGVDRTDYIKGIPHKIRGFQRFLARNPEREREVVLLQIGIPSRLDVKEYASYVAKISEMVTEVNGAVGDITNTPVHLLLRSVPFTELVALYAVADILLVTSIMDGMNLVAMEYVACQGQCECSHAGLSCNEHLPGAVVLSKFAGATATLQGALQHNPNNTEEIAEAIEKALALPADERVRRHSGNARNVEVFTSVRWAQENLECVEPDWKAKLAPDEGSS